MPGLALAGGVLIAALLALFLMGDGYPGSGQVPETAGPTATRLLYGEETGRPAGRHETGGESAAATQYGSPGRGIVIPGGG